MSLDERLRGCGLSRVVVCLGLLLLAPPGKKILAQVPADEEALTALEKFGARVHRPGFVPWQKVLHVMLRGNQINATSVSYLKKITSDFNLAITAPASNEDLERLPELPKVKGLGLSRCEVTDAGLEVVKKFVNLEGASIRLTHVTGPGLVHLRALPHFEHLILADNEHVPKGKEPPASAQLKDEALEAISELSNLRILQITGKGITDAGVGRLSKLSNLEELTLYCPRMTDAGLRILEGMSNLTTLNVLGDGVTGSGLEACRNLEHLQILSLSSKAFDDAGLANLGHALSSLEELTLDTPKLTNASLSNLKGANHLRHLKLSQTAINGLGLVHLEPLTSLTSLTLRRVNDVNLRHLVTLNELESLSLVGSELTDAGMLYLGGLPKLRELNLSVTEVSDESFEIFQEMKSLRTLDLRDTLVTQNGVDAFAKARPDIRVQAAPATSIRLAEQKQRKPLKRLQIGKTVPDLKATTLDGKPLTLSEFRGKFLVVFCWATWCGPCKEEIPYLQVLQKAFANDPRVAILGLSLDKAADDAAKYVKNHDMPWPQGYISLNVVDQAGEAIATGGLPSIYLLAPDGIVLARGLRGEKIKATLEDVLRGDSGTSTLPMP